jgi:hypothetical protein
MSSKSSDPKKDSSKEPAPAPGKADQKAPETVQLSAEELRKISGGAAVPGPGPVKGH